MANLKVISGVDEKVLAEMTTKELLDVITQQASLLQKYIVPGILLDDELEFKEQNEEQLASKLKELSEANTNQTKQIAHRTAIKWVLEYARKINEKLGSISEENKAAEMFKNLQLASSEYNQVIKEEIKEIRNALKNKTINEITLSHADVKLPSFSGNRDERIEDWIFLIENYMAIRGISEDLIVPLILPLMKGQALTFYQQFSREKPNKRFIWKDLRDVLIIRFTRVDEQRVLREELRKLSSKDGIKNYIKRFETISSKIIGMPKQEVIFSFIEGLTGKVKYEVISKRPQTLIDAIAYANIYADCCSDKDEINVINYAQTKFPRKPKWKTNFLKKNGFNKKYNRNGEKIFNESKNDYKKKVPFKKNRSKIICYKCKKEGHIAINCRTRKVYSVNAPTEGKKDDSGDYQEKIYSYKTDPDSLLTAYGRVNGIKTKFGLDSGATASIMSKLYAKKHNINVLPSSVKVKTANNDVSNVKGITENLEVEVEGNFCRMKFLVTEHEDHEILLGLDWFRETGAGIFPLERILKFPSKRVILNKNNKNKIIEEIYLEEQCLITEVDEFKFVATAETEEIELEYEGWDFSKEYLPPIDEKKFNSEEVKSIKRFLKETDELWRKASARGPEELGRAKIPKFKIRIKDVPPIFIPQFKRSIAEENELDEIVKKMHKDKIIENSNSEWNFPIFLVKKKDGTSRPVVDFRLLNAITINEPFPIDTPEAIFNRVSQAKWFAAVDMTCGFWQQQVDESSRDYLSFSTRSGRYRFTKMPFGVKNAPSAFSRALRAALGDLNYLEMYIDDMILRANTLENHLKNIKSFLQRLVELDLKIKPAKCEWFANEIHVLGHIISGDNIKMDPSKVEAISKRNEPSNIKELQQFLGICNYYRKFVKDYAHMAAPLFKLLKTENEWNWNDEQQTAFTRLKENLVSYPILRQPDFKKQFFIYTDASNYALGAVLSQKEDKRDYAIAYASRLMKGAEHNYGITEKECLAVVWAVKQFRNYIYGTEFVIITDHSALSWLMNIKDPTGRLARWATYLQAYSFTIVHRKGLIHSNADALSRPPISKTKSVLAILSEEDSVKHLEPYEDESLLYYLKFKKCVNGLPKKQVKRIVKLAEYFSWQDNMLHYKDKIYPKIEERKGIIEKAHEFGHFQTEATFQEIYKKYYWKKMRIDIQQFIKDCEKCKRHHKVKSIEHPAKAIPVTGIFDRVGIDLIGGLPESDGYRWILMIVDSLSKYIYVKPLKSKSGEEVSEKLSEFISIFGPPKIILSDKGTEFCNSIVSHYLKSLNVEHKVTSSYHPRTNGLTERLNGIFMEILNKITEAEINSWPHKMKFAMMAYNNKVNTITGFSPYKLVFGKEQNQFQNWLTIPEDLDTNAVQERTKNIDEMESIRNRALRNVSNKQESQKRNQNNQHTITTKLLESGTEVYVENKELGGKLKPRYYGPFFVEKITERETYILRNALNQVMKDEYPRERLKVTNEKPKKEDIFEVQKILSSRMKNGKNEFLVKWKNLSNMHNSWEVEENFIDMKPIKIYLEKRDKNKGSKHKMSLRTRNSEINNLISVILFLISLFMGVACTENKINDKFYYCAPVQENMIYNTPFLSIEDGCKEPVHTRGNIINKKVDSTIENAWIISKETNEVDGYGYSCYQEDISVSSFVNFFGARSVDIARNTINLTAEECFAMVTSKNCGPTKMTCTEEKGCSYDGTPEPQFKWLQGFTARGNKCYFRKRTIIAKNPNSYVSGTKCLAKDLRCNINTETWVWPINIVYKCPYKKIATIKKLFVEYDDILSTRAGQMFKINGKREICKGIKVWSTTEGLYITDSQQANELEQSRVELTAIHELMLSENDANKLESRKKIEKVKKELCEELSATLRILKEHSGTYEVLTLGSGKTIVVYSKGGLLFLPKCVIVEQIEIMPFEKNACRKDPVVTFNLNHREKREVNIPPPPPKVIIQSQEFDYDSMDKSLFPTAPPNLKPRLPATRTTRNLYPIFNTTVETTTKTSTTLKTTTTTMPTKNVVQSVYNTDLPIIKPSNLIHENNVRPMDEIKQDNIKIEVKENTVNLAVSKDMLKAFQAKEHLSNMGVKDKIKAYLSSSRILKPYSESCECEEQYRYFPEANKMLIISDKKVEIIDSHNAVPLHTYEYAIQSNSYTHYKKLLEDVDLIEEIHRISIEENLEEKNKIFKMKLEDEKRIDASGNIIKTIGNVWDETEKWVDERAKRIKILSISVLVILLILIILLKFLLCYRKKSRKNANRTIQVNNARKISKNKQSYNGDEAKPLDPYTSAIIKDTLYRSLLDK